MPPSNKWKPICLRHCKHKPPKQKVCEKSFKRMRLGKIDYAAALIQKKTSGDRGWRNDLFVLILQHIPDNQDSSLEQQRGA